MTYHRDYAYLTNYDNYLKWAPVSGFSRRFLETKHWHITGRQRQYTNDPLLKTLVPRRTEGYDFWSYYTRSDFFRSWLWTVRPSAPAVIRSRKVIDLVARLQGKPHFASKLTGPGRIGFLRSLFPQAKFIHLIRDGRAQVQSLLNVGFWKQGGGHDRLWWDKDMPPLAEAYLLDAERTGNSAALAAAQWRAIIEAIRAEASLYLRRDEYREVRYEEFVSHPLSTVRSLWSWAGRDGDSRAEDLILTYPLRSDMNAKQKNYFSESDAALLLQWLGPPMREYVEEGPGI